MLRINNDSDLVPFAVTLQKREGLSDSKFAEKIGVTRRLWGKTRNRDCAVGIKVIKALVTTYWEEPLVIQEVLNFLRDGSGNA